MSVMANSVPLFQVRISSTVLDVANKKIAVTTEPRGGCPWAESSAAFRTKKAASTGTSRATTTSVTKLLKLVSTPLTHGLSMLPDCGGNTIPCAAIQETTC